MKTSCILIDDEPSALELLEDYVSKTSFLELKGQFDNGQDALNFLSEQPVDVIITDIVMPGMSGLELAAVLPPDQKFIFITGHEKYALHSFGYRVIDYILKPVPFPRFLQALTKIGSSIELQPPVYPGASYLFVKSSGQMVRINFDEIIYIKGAREYVSLHFKEKRLLIYRRMKEMEQLLPTNFIRVHVSYIINVNHLVKVAAKYAVTGSDEIPISGSYRGRLQQYIDPQSF